ncbi:MAG TPA: QueT transporter family protein [Candidatus Borkfalkia stercoripullorum]|nr:QueT transporter family protein [Candidatus Borkfalkia stercoripullorum]
MKRFSTKMLCRAGIIAALYVALTYAFGALSYNGFLQIRPAEALCILPLFFPEAVPALYIGCMLANIASPFWVYDVFVGSLATLAAATGTWLIGRYLKNHVLRIALGGLFPVLLNAFVIPVIIVFLCGDLSYGTQAATYWTYVGSLAVTEALWVYALGAPLYLGIKALRDKGVTAFTDNAAVKKSRPAKEETPQTSSKS